MPHGESDIASAIEQSANTVVVTDTSGKIEYVNNGFSTLTGYSKSEVLGRNPRLLQSGSTPQETYKSLWKTLLCGRPWTGELLNHKKNGDNYWEAITITPIRNGDGLVAHFLAVISDISEKKQLEQENRDTLKRLMRSIQVLEQFNAILSHDLKGPLGNIMLGLDYLRQQPPLQQDQSLQAVIASTQSSAGKVEELLNDLMLYTRASIQRERQLATHFNLRALIDSVCHSLAAEIQQARIALRIDELPMVYGDSVLLRQVLQNLIANSIKYCQRESAQIWISAQTHPSYWLVSIADNGIGIAEKDRKRIFAPFQRGENVGNQPGTGLGLAICERVIDLHGGHIWVESKEGIGSRFNFTLPRTG